MKTSIIWHIKHYFWWKLRHIFNPFEALSMGNVGAYSIIIDKKDTGQWIKKGWVERPRFTDDHYFPKKNQTVMLGIPQTILEKGTEHFKDKIIHSIGEYGHGFWGIKVVNSDGTERENIVFAVYAAGEYILIDDRILSCHPDLYTNYHPWLSLWGGENIEQWDDLSPILVHSIIKDIKVYVDRVIITVSHYEELHKIEFLKNDKRLAPFVKAKYKFDSFKKGKIGDYVLVTQEKTALHTYR